MRNYPLGLIERVSEYIDQIRAKVSVERAFLFGSTARESRLAESDVDIIIVSQTFRGMPLPKRLALLQKEWSYEEELQTLAYTPEEFLDVSQRSTMQEILSYAVDVSTNPGACPRCSRRGSLQRKQVHNRSGATYAYYYYAHYSDGRVKWCYVGKTRPIGIMSTIGH